MVDWPKIMEEMIERVKLKVIETYEHRTVTERKWLESSPRDSYNDPAHRVRLFVLSGSPPKGYVLASYAIHKVRGFDAGLHPLCICTYEFGEVKDGVRMVVTRR